MDRYELNVKMEQIKKLARQKEYAAAAKIADTIDFYRIKENKSLQLLADVYEASGKYNEAKEILIEAYARTTLGRQFAYRLVKLCIKSGNISEAEDFYDDFINAAPKDNSKYILQYELAAAKGQSIEERIKILETYLSDDMDEKWAYELAKLYHKSGQKDKCVRQCDDVILWFNDGKYVDKAMELKMLYTPLTKSQQEKYEKRWRAKTPSNVNVEEIKVKEYDAANKYNTVNIQNALKESMDVIMNEEDMYDQQAKNGSEQQDDLEKTKVVFTDEVVNSLLSHTIKDVSVPDKYKTVPLSPMLDMDSDGQIQMTIEEEPVDDQIEGQITIGELLDSYEKREAQLREQAEKQNISQETKRLYNEENNASKEALAEVSVTEEPDSDEYEASTDLLSEEISASEELEDDLPDEDFADEEISEGLAEPSGAFDTSYYSRPKEAVKETAGEISSVEEEDIEAEFADNQEAAPEESEKALEEAGELFGEETETPPEAVSEEETEEISEEKQEIVSEDKTEAVSEEQENEMSHDGEKENISDENKQPSNQVSSSEVKELIKDFVTKYSGVQGLDRQLLAVLQEVLINHNTNLIVMGEVKSGKTALAIDLVKIINKIQQVRGRKIAKINGEVLNEENVSEYFEKLAGMDIIVERAGLLKSPVADKIIEEIETKEALRIVVLEDEKTNIEAFLSENSRIDNMFKGRVVVKQNKIRDWALVAKKYADSQGYEIDEMGILALHARIDDLYAVSLLIGKKQVEEIVDNAIKKSKSKRLGKILKLFGREREKILREEDFS